MLLHSSREISVRKPEAMEISPKDEMCLTGSAVYIAARRQLIPNYQIIAQNIRENQIIRDLSTLCKILKKMAEHAQMLELRKTQWHATSPKLTQS